MASTRIPYPHASPVVTSRPRSAPLFVWLFTLAALLAGPASPQDPPSSAALQIEALLLETGLRRPPSPPPGAPAMPATATGSVDYRLRLSPPPQGAPPSPQPLAQKPAPGPFALISARPQPSPVPRQRNPEFHPSLLLAVAVGAHEELLSWTLVPDPRILRAESPLPSGLLQGQTLWREDADLLISFPADARLREIRLFERVWPDPQLRIRPLGSAPAGGEQQ